MTDIFIGRQPIFDKNMNVFAYELLFRNGMDSLNADVIDGDSATSQVLMNCFFEIGLQNIVGSHKAFINMTRLFLSNPELIIEFPPDQLVLEVLENIEPTDEIINALKWLKKSGHTIALDDFIYSSKFDPLISLASIIKIDITALNNSQIKQHVEQLKTFNLKLLAEKVETYDEFEFLKDLDFDYFQGYFFSKPVIVKGRALAPNQLTVLQLLAKINDPNVDVEELSVLISSDVSLSHKVLKFINSPVSALRTQIDSIQQAVVLLGLATIKNWVTIMAMATGSKKPVELGKTALVRARCCEMLAKAIGHKKADGYFTVGLFSSLDAMMDQPLEVLLDELPLSNDSKLALLEHKGVFGEALECTLAMECGDFSDISFGSLEIKELSDIYLKAIHWADELAKNVLSVS